MNDRPLRSDAEAERRLDELLGTMHAFAPHPGFEDRVMARVRRPAPQLVRRARMLIEAAGSRGGWMLAAASAAGTIFWSGLAASWLTTNSYAIRAGAARLAVEVAVPLWREVVGSLAPATVSLAQYVIAQAETIIPTIGVALLVAVFLPPVCAWGLYRLMTPPRTETVYAMR